MSKKLMTHIVAGYPSLHESEKLARMMTRYSDFIEIQIPFSDPVADGPTIMRANQHALNSGVTVEDCFMLMEKLRDSRTPLLFMSYFNILFRYNVEKFCERAAQCGCYGLIVPDIPIDEEKYEGYLAACKKYNLHAIQVVSPLTTGERLKIISRVASGFVYCVSRFGVTGRTLENDKKNSGANFGKYIQRVRKFIHLPLAVGFGISERSQVKAVWEHADIAVIGSSIIEKLDTGGVNGVENFLEKINS